MVSSSVRELRRLFNLTFVPSKWARVRDVGHGMLEKRAWLTHTLMTVYRLVLMAANYTSWQRALANPGAAPEHNTDLFDAVKEPLPIALWSITLVGLFVDLLCCKKLQAARALFYVELLYLVALALVPFGKGVAESQLIVVQAALAAVCLYCDPLFNFLFLVAALLWLTTAQIPMVWDLTDDSEYLVEALVLCIASIIFFVGVSLATSYTAKLEEVILTQEKDDFNLLNEMQEGIIVMDSEMNEVKFGSKTALRIMSYRQDVLAGCDM